MDWTGSFPLLADLSAPVRNRVVAESSLVALPAAARLFGPGQSPDNFLMLISGSIRVQQIGESGREIVLYRLAPGESCTLTTACLLAGSDYEAEAIAETDIRAVVLGRRLFDELIATCPEFRRFVFAGFGSRLTSLFRLIEDVAFSRLDARLAELLTRSSTEVIATTHQALANELGSAREVISRCLGDFQRRGWIRSARGEIEIVDRPALARLADKVAARKLVRD
jgi:CRP/FNR family transcriptional regulator